MTALGYSLGRIYQWTPERRRSFLWRLGLALTLAFVVIRALNVYGDPQPWSPQKTALFTALSFLDVNKYPPSLLFLLMTLGPALGFLVFDGATPRVLRPAVVFGRVPLFYYAVHFFLIHLVAVAVCFAGHGTAHWLFESPDLANYPFTPPPNWGFSLPLIDTISIAIVVAMYPLCRWFAALKQRRDDAWLSYL